MSENTIEVTDANFEAEVLKADKPVLVDFWAEWCGPCKAIAPVLEEVAVEFAGKVTIGKINVDNNQDIPAKFGVRGIPTLILFINGEVKETKVGALQKSELVNFLNDNLEA